MTKELRHVVCIDDEEDILAVAKMSLEAVGQLEVTTYNGARAALAGLETVRPDLILLDVMMPELDGPATLKELRRTPAFLQIPILFMTARVQPAEIAHYRELGAFDVISKPFDPMALSDTVKERWHAYQKRNAA